MSLKQWSLGSPLGRALMSTRNTMSLFHTGLTRPEQLGTLANDQIAATALVKLCRPERVFVDVGAHIGSVVAAVLHHDRSIRVVAVEAIPAKVEALRRKFPGITVHQCAIGRAAGRAQFFAAKQSGYSSLSKPPDKAGATVAFDVEVKPLDALITSSDVDVVKIDVEGAELEALIGATGLLERNRPFVMFESACVSPNVTELWRYFAARDYAIVVPNRLAHKEPSGMSLEAFEEGHLYPRRTTNYFAIPTERRDEAGRLAAR